MYGSNKARKKSRASKHYHDIFLVHKLFLRHPNQMSIAMNSPPLHQVQSMNHPSQFVRSNAVCNRACKGLLMLAEPLPWSESSSSTSHSN